MVKIKGANINGNDILEKMNEYCNIWKKKLDKINSSNWKETTIIKQEYVKEYTAIRYQTYEDAFNFVKDIIDEIEKERN